MKKLYFLLFTLMFTVASSFGQVVINEIDVDTPGSDTEEFVELKAAPNTSLDGYIVVFFNGSNDLSYGTWDLTGKTTDANGFFILANTSLVSGSDIELPPGGSGYVQNGPDAIAIYQDSAANFPDGTGVTTTNLIDVIVYSTNDSDDVELLSGFGETVQWNESANGANATESLQLNAAGTAYETKAPTFRASNDTAVCELSLTATSATCDAFTVGTDTYTATVDFTGGGTSTYTVESDSGVVDLTGGDPSTDAAGTITVTGIAEGTDVIISVVDGVLCDLSSTVTSPSCAPSNSLPLYEGFDYTVGANLDDQPNWTGFFSGDNVLIGGPGGLTYPGLADGTQTGNHISFDGSGIDNKLEFTGVTSGTVYASFIFTITDQSSITDLADGGYFAALSETDASFDTRLWVHPNTDPVGTTYEISITNASSNPTFAGTYNVGDNLLIVFSYEPGTGNIKGWVNPSSLGGTEPTPDFSETDASPANTIDRFVVRQDSAGETPSILFDELRIGTSYAEVTPMTLSNNEFTADNFKLFPNPTSNGIVNILSNDNDTMNVQVFDILGKQVKNEILRNNTLNVSDLNSGIYIVKITQNDASTTKKLVIK